MAATARKGKHGKMTGMANGAGQHRKADPRKSGSNKPSQNANREGKARTNLYLVVALGCTILAAIYFLQSQRDRFSTAEKLLESEKSETTGSYSPRHTPRNWQMNAAPALKKRITITGWTNTSAPRPPPEELFSSVKAWVEKNGGIVHPSLMYSSGNETETGAPGLVVNSDCKAGETLYKIPQTLWLMSHMGRILVEACSINLSKLEVSKKDGVWELAVLIAYERSNRNSPAAPYIKSLPECPSIWCYGDEDFEKLKRAKLSKVQFINQRISFIMQRRKEIHEVAWNIVKQLHEMATLDISFEELIWAFGIVSSRSYSTPVTTDYDVSLLPIADLPNHDPKWQTMDFDDENDKMWGQYTLSKDVKARSEVLVSYHALKADYDFVSDYGFVPSTNDRGRASKITFGHIDYSMWKRARKEGLWGTLAPAEQGNHQVLLSGQIVRKGFMPSPELMGFARTVASVTEQDRGYRLFDMDDISLSVMNGIMLLSKEIEIAALELIRVWMKNFINVHTPVLEMRTSMKNGERFSSLEELVILAESQNINLYHEAIRKIEDRAFCLELFTSIPQCSTNFLSSDRVSHVPC